MTDQHLAVRLALIVAMLGGCGDSAVSPIKTGSDTRWAERVDDPSVKSKTGATWDLPAVRYSIKDELLTFNAEYSQRVIWKDEGWLTFVIYNGNRTGGRIGRIDVAQKRVVYLIPIVGLGPVDHSQYANSISVFTDASHIKLIGQETHGRYEEVRDLRTGALVHLSQAYSRMHAWPETMIVIDP